MPALPCFILLVTAAVVVGWFVAEVKGPAWTRITLGTASLVMSFGIAVAVAGVFRLQYDVEYGGAAAGLIDEVLVRLEAGDDERLADDLRELRKDVQASYEVPPFQEVVAEFVDRSRASRQTETEPAPCTKDSACVPLNGLCRTDVAPLAFQPLHRQVEFRWSALR